MTKGYLFALNNCILDQFEKYFDLIVLLYFTKNKSYNAVTDNNLEL